LKNELSRALYWVLGIPRSPARIEIHPTDMSNVKKGWCWRNWDKKPPEPSEIPQETLEKIVGEGIEMGVKEWVISGGGEPLLLKEGLIKIMRPIKENLFYGDLHTNGTMFTAGLVSDIVEMGWDRILFQLFSPESDVNDEIMETEGVFSRMSDALEMLRDTKEELGTTRPRVDIYMPLTTQNFGDIGSMLKFAKRKRVSNLLVEPFYPLSAVEDVDDLLVMDEEQMMKFRNDVPRLRALARSLRMGIEIAPLDIPERRGEREGRKKPEKEVEESGEEIKGSLDPRNVHCLEPYLSMVIRPSGGVGPCPVAWYEAEKDRERITPDTLSKQNLADVWYGHFFTMLRDNARTEPPADYCTRCTPNLQKKQITILKGLRLNRDRFMERTLKQIMQEAEKDEGENKEIQDRLKRIRELKEELATAEEELQTTRGYHLELEKIRSSGLYRVLRALRILRE